jgi:vacuolar-type H+-ATPase subunit I/STV1
MILGIDRLLKRVGILPDTPTALERENKRLQEIHDADKVQEELIEEARHHLEKRGVRDMTERQFMEELLQARRRRNGESSQ